MMDRRRDGKARVTFCDVCALTKYKGRDRSRIEWRQGENTQGKMVPLIGEGGGFGKNIWNINLNWQTDNLGANILELRLNVYFIYLFCVPSKTNFSK